MESNSSPTRERNGSKNELYHSSFQKRKQKDPVVKQGLFVSSEILQQGGVDGAEGIADLGSEQAHNCDHDDGDESEDDGVLNETLTFFFGCE